MSEANQSFSIYFFIVPTVQLVNGVNGGTIICLFTLYNIVFVCACVFALCERMQWGWGIVWSSE